MKPQWLRLLAQIAPALAGALGGPLAAGAVAALGKVLLGKADATEAEVELALGSATPDQLMAIKKADQEFAVKMKELGIDLEKVRISAEVEDRVSAREMLVKTISNLKGLPQVLLTVLYQAGVFSMLYILFSSAVKGSLKDIPDFWQGVFSSLLTLIVQGALSQLRFWYGGSFRDQVAIEQLGNSVPANLLPKATNGNGGSL